VSILLWLYWQNFIPRVISFDAYTKDLSHYSSFYPYLACGNAESGMCNPDGPMVVSDSLANCKTNVANEPAQIRERTNDAADLASYVTTNKQRDLGRSVNKGSSWRS